jgi:hypothetical protein
MDNNRPSAAPPNLGRTDLQYLDNINTPVPNTKYSLFRDRTFIKILAIAISVIVIAVVAGLIYNSQSRRGHEIIETLSIRFTNLSTLRSTYGQDPSFPPQLRKISTNLGISLTQASRGIAPFLPEFDINPQKPNPQISANESTIFSDLNTTFAEARVNGRLSRAFAQGFFIQINEVSNLLHEFDTRVPRPDIHEFVLSTRTDLQALNLELEAFINHND